MTGLLIDAGWQRPRYFSALAAPLPVAVLLLSALSERTSNQDTAATGAVKPS